MHIFDQLCTKFIPMKTLKNILTLVVLAIFIAGCAPAQTNCGTKKDHKARMAKTKRMAPSMSGGR